MTVRELIEELEKCPQDNFVEILSEMGEDIRKIRYVSMEDEIYNLIYIVVS